MALSLKERCRKFIAQQNLSEETARLFSEEVRGDALRADTVRRLLSEMAAPKKTPGWVKGRFAEAALRDADALLAQSLMTGILALDAMNPPNEAILLQYVRLAALLMKRAEDESQNAQGAARPGPRLDLAAADAVLDVLTHLDLRSFMRTFEPGRRLDEPNPEALHALQAEIHSLLPAIVRRCSDPGRYGLTPEDAASFLFAVMGIEYKLQLTIPALANLAEVIMDALEAHKGSKKTRQRRDFADALKHYFELDMRLRRRTMQLYAPIEAPLPEAFDETAERLARRAAKLTKVTAAPESILRAAVRLELSRQFSEESTAASDLVQSLILNEKVAFASEAELRALRECFPEHPAVEKKGKGRGARLEKAMARILSLRELRLSGGPDALIHHALAAAASAAPLPDYEFALCHSLLVAAGIECEAPECLDLALQMESRPEAQRVAASPEGARFAFWRARRIFNAAVDRDMLAHAMAAFAYYFPSDSDTSVPDHFAGNENRRMRTLFGRRSPSLEAERTLKAMTLSFKAQAASARSAMKTAGEKASESELRTLAERLEADLKRFMPDERGLEWWTAAVFAQSTLAKLADPKKDAGEFCRRYAALEVASEQVYYAAEMTARLLTKEVAQAHAAFDQATNVLEREGFELDFRPWPRSFDLPWFPELEKRLGRIIRHFCLYETFSVVEVADAWDPDLVHLVTTCMSGTFFKNSPGMDHEYFITISKKGADPAPAPSEKIASAIPAAAPLSKLEFAAALLLYAVYRSSIMTPNGDFQDNIIVTHRDEEAVDAARAAGIADDYLHDAALLPLVPNLPYKAVVSCDLPEIRRVDPFHYGPGRTMRLTACVPLYAEELQFAADYSLDVLFERFGCSTFTPMRQSRENAVADFYKGELIPHEQLRNLLPEGIEDLTCFVEARILKEGASIERCVHIRMATGDEMWAFRAAEAGTDERIGQPDGWRRTKLSTICNYDASIRPILSAPSGTAFKRGPNGLFVRDTDYEDFLRALMRIERASDAREADALMRDAMEAAQKAGIFPAGEESPADAAGGLWQTMGEDFDDGEGSGGQNGAGRRDN